MVEKTGSRTLCSSKPPVFPQLGGENNNFLFACLGSKNQVSCRETSAARCTLAGNTWQPRLSMLTSLKPDILWPECQVTHVHLMLSTSMWCSFWGDVGDWWMFFQSAGYLHQIILIRSPSSGCVDHFVFIVSPSSLSLCWFILNMLPSFFHLQNFILINSSVWKQQ